jgi:hypothetical protein
MTEPDPGGDGTRFPDTSWEAHRRRRAVQGLDLTPAERLRWLESTMATMREWQGRARALPDAEAHHRQHDETEPRVDPEER